MLVATLLGRVAAELTAQDGLLLYCAAFAAQATAWSLAPTRSRAPARSSPRPELSEDIKRGLAKGGG